MVTLSLIITMPESELQDGLEAFSTGLSSPHRPEVVDVRVLLDIQPSYSAQLNTLLATLNPPLLVEIRIVEESDS